MLSEEIQIQIDSHDKEFKKYEKFIKGNDWVSESNPQTNYETEKLLADSTIMVLTKFCEENKDFVKISEVKKFIKNGLKVIDKHVDRVEKYLIENDWSSNIFSEDINKLKEDISEEEINLEVEEDDTKKDRIEDKIISLKKQLLALEKRKKDEIEFQAKAHNGKVTLLSKKSKLNIEGDKDKKSAENMFFSKAKAPLLMRSFLSEVIPDVKKFDEGLNINWDNPNPETSNELFINMKPKDIPKYDETKHYWEQDRDVLQFWGEEANKIKNGVTLNGYKMTPYMYWTMNFYKIALGTGAKRTIKNIDIRDNEYLFDYMLSKAEEHGRCGLLLYGTRRWSKSVNLASRLVFSLLTIENCQGSVQGFSGVDLGQLVTYMNECFNTLPTAFRMNLLKNNDKGFEAGIKKTAQDAYKYGELNFLNLEAGSRAGSQKTAGGTPSVSVFDEIGKGDIQKPWGAAIPSFEGGDNGKWRCTPLLAGCVCAGTKVYNHEGNLVNIEDLTKEEGILGFNKETKKISKEPITWMQPPSEKRCYKFTLKNGIFLECSYEHPILLESGEFKATEDLQIGDKVVCIKDVQSGESYIQEVDNIEYIGVKPIYNLTAGATNTYIANMIVTHNTAGDGELSKDAEEILQDPKTFEIMLMDWDQLDSMAGEENRTWNRRPFSFFLPAQMNLSVPKIKTNFAEFVGVEDEQLSKVPFYKTDWDKAKKHFESQRELKRKNQKALGEEIRFHPLDPEDVFLSGEKNPFDALQMKNWKAEIVLNDVVGGKYEMTMPDGEIIPQLSDKPVIDRYPFKGGNIDSPVIILEHPEKEPMDDLYVIGFDDAKQETSDGDSVRSAVVFKREAFLGDSFANSVVAYYDSRQDRPEDYYYQLYMLMKYYNARVFHENEDNGYVDFLERLFPIDATKYLIPSINFSDALGDNFYVNKNRRYGYSPQGGNNSHLLKRTVAYTKADIGDGLQNGFKRIRYPMLLEEMIQYRKENNADRLRAFGLAVIISEYLDKMYIEPRKPKKWEREKNNEGKKNHLRGGLTSTKRFKKRF